MSGILIAPGFLIINLSSKNIAKGEPCAHYSFYYPFFLP